MSFKDRNVKWKDIFMVMELSSDVGISINSSTFDTYLAELKRNGLIRVVDGSVVASEELFP